MHFLFTHTMLRMESFSLMAWRHFLHRATDEWTYRLSRKRRKRQLVDTHLILEVLK